MPRKVTMMSYLVSEAASERHAQLLDATLCRLSAQAVALFIFLLFSRHTFASTLPLRDEPVVSGDQSTHLLFSRYTPPSNLVSMINSRELNQHSLTSPLSHPIDFHHTNPTGEEKITKKMTQPVGVEPPFLAPHPAGVGRPVLISHDPP